MEIIDAQVHLGTGPAAAGPRPVPPDGRVTVYRDRMVEAMRAVGVDAALATTRSLGPQNNDDALGAAQAYPEKFAVVGTMDPAAADLDELMRAWRARPGCLALRIVLLRSDQIARWRQREYEPLLAAAEKHGVPVCMYPPRLLAEVLPAIRRYPRVQFVMDHLGLPQPTFSTDRDDPPFARVRELLDLAALPNVAVKLTGVPTLATLPFPYPDVWPHIHAILSAFGLERVMWGSDWTRTLAWCSYEESVDYVRGTSELSAHEKEWLLGRSLRQVFRWSRRPQME